MVFNITDGREAFSQWDRDQTITINPKADELIGKTISEVHIYNNATLGAFVCAINLDNTISVPNILLTSDNDIYIMAVFKDQHDQRTEARQIFHVHTRKKPQDYVYGETEVYEYKDYIRRLEAVEKTTIEIGDVVTLEEKLKATVTITVKNHDDGTRTYYMDFGIPKGATGDTGPLPNIHVGSVTSLPFGENPTVTIDGTPEAPVLNFGIPEGDKIYVGPGEMPEGYNLQIDPDGTVLSFSDSFSLSDDGKINLTPATADTLGGVKIGDNINIDEDGVISIDNYIPSPSTAEVGQTIVVKAVDDNGKPTEWEAADLPKAKWITLATQTVEETGVTSMVFENFDVRFKEFALFCELKTASDSAMDMVVKINNRSYTIGDRLQGGIFAVRLWELFFIIGHDGYYHVDVTGQHTSPLNAGGITRHTCRNNSLAALVDEVKSITIGSWGGGVLLPGLTVQLLYREI